MGSRKLARKCDRVRRLDKRACICAHYIRPHYGAGPCRGLSNICNWVRVFAINMLCHWLTKHSYLNGSILLATLQPAFNILHTLSTPRAPSSIVSLAWHASSTKQKSDMLATQTADGDLRVWSVSKPAAAAAAAAPQTIRVLKSRDNVDPGLNWAAWSKNGRILQFSDG